MAKADFEHVGRKIREERRRCGLTLGEVAKSIGVSPSYISLVENAKSIPSLKILDKICSRLSIHLSTLFADAEPKRAHGFALFRQRSHVVVNISQQRKLTVLLPKIGAPMEPVHLAIQPGDEHNSASSHKGTEFGYVVSGQVEFTISNQTKGLFQAGDSLLYNAMLPHTFTNKSTDPAELLLVAMPQHEWEEI